MKSIFFFLWIGVFVFPAFVSCRNGSNTKNIAKPYQLVWGDEFDYKGLPDSTLWSYDTAGNATGWGNHELEYYTANRMENARVDSGILTITAVKERYNGRDYTSARLRTLHKGDWLYGKVEVRAKLPEGRGCWPAIWMLPTDFEYGGWPESGEIDIMELVGFMPDSVFATIHNETDYSTSAILKSKGIFIHNTAQDFHVYGMEWQPDSISFYLDDKKFFSFVNPKTGFKDWPFDKRFHLLLNIAVGGDWGGTKGVDDSTLPYKMQVDYVRIYQR